MVKGVCPMSEKIQIDDWVEVSVKVGRKWFFFRGKVEKQHGDRFLVRYTADPKMGRETTVGWYLSSQLERETRRA
jgi:hypothetical protein